MKVTEFVNKAKDIANNYKTLYVMGCFGAPMNDTNKKRYTNNHSYNKQATRTKMINSASSDTFGFDCVCFIKGILWGWNGNVNKIYGGATYTSNGVPDVGADGIMNYCTNVSKDFNNISIGEIVHMSGHVGIYIGNSEVVECTPAWKNKVQITKLSQRKWLNHGKLKFVDYSEEVKEVIPVEVKEVIPVESTIVYIVVKGDNLSKIAKKFNTTWQKIYNDNKNIIGSNPNLIYAGQKLVIK